MLIFKNCPKKERKIINAGHLKRHHEFSDFKMVFDSVKTKIILSTQSRYLWHCNQFQMLDYFSSNTISHPICEQHQKEIFIHCFIFI